MTKQRTEIGFADSLEDLKPDDWKPAAIQKSVKSKPPHEDIRKIAQATGFKSREAAPVSPPREEAVTQEEVVAQPVREGRLFRTGRSEQLNLKVRGVDKTSFYSICDRNHWVQGYTFQRAIEALEREQKDATPLPQALDRSA